MWFQNRHAKVDNAVNSVKREISNRYDFKGAEFAIELKQRQFNFNFC